MMKFKLLLCYALAIGEVCFALETFNEEDSSTEEILSSSIEAMGENSFVAQKKSVMNAQVASSEKDPYSSVQQKDKVDHVLGDPYAKTEEPLNVAVGDPYAKSGLAFSENVPQSAAVPVKKIKTTLKEKAISYDKLDKPKTVVSKKIEKSEFVPREQQPLTAALFKSLHGDDAVVKEAQDAIYKIELEERAREGKLRAAAQENLVSVKKEISQKALELRAQADLAARELKEKTESQVQALLDAAEGRIQKLNSEVVREAVSLKKEAARKAFDVMSDFEMRAAQKRIEQRQQFLAKKFGVVAGDFNDSSIVPKLHEVKSAVKTEKKETNKASDLLVSSKKSDQKKADPVAIQSAASLASSSALRVTPEWKNDVSRQFYQDMSTMKNIITQAESPFEVRDFIKKFEDQNRWFDLTLRSTKLVTDDSYGQLVAKQSQMSRLMAAQRIADSYLSDFTRNMILDPVQLKKMRLSILYELNAQIQQRAAHLDRSVREGSLSGDEIKVFVKRVLSDSSQQFKDIAAQFPDVELSSSLLKKPQLSLAAVPLKTQELEKELEEVRAQADEVKQQLSEAQTRLTKAEQGLTEAKSQAEKTKDILEKEKSLKEKLLSQNDVITKASFEVLGRQTREVVDTQLKMEEITQDSSLLKKELALASAENNSLKDQKKALVSSVEKAQKNALESDLSRTQVLVEAHKSIADLKKQAKLEVRYLKESGAKAELGLTADLRQAHEKISKLRIKQDKLLQDLREHKAAALQLKGSLKESQEKAEKSTLQATLAENALKDAEQEIQRQRRLREEARKRAKATEELAQQTIDSINSFLNMERKSLIAKKRLEGKEKTTMISANHVDEENLGVKKDSFEVYKKQLMQDRTVLKNLRDETLKIVQDAEVLSGSLNDDFVEMQEQIENELRLAQEETKKEILTAQERFDDLEEDDDVIDQSKNGKILVEKSEDEPQASKVTLKMTKKVAMPSPKKLALN